MSDTYVSLLPPWDAPSELDALYEHGLAAVPPTERLRQLHWNYQFQLAEYRDYCQQMQNPDLRDNVAYLLLLLVPKLVEACRELAEAKAYWMADGRLASYAHHAGLPALDRGFTAQQLLNAVGTQSKPHET